MLNKNKKEGSDKLDEIKKQKMLNGELYFSGDAELVQEQINARRLTRIFNATFETEVVKRTMIEIP